MYMNSGDVYNVNVHCTYTRVKRKQEEKYAKLEAITLQPNMPPRTNMIDVHHFIL